MQITSKIESFINRKSPLKTFQPETIPLDGYALIEASAGTGKTYSITSLYLRFIMERNLKPGEILVVTYTRAATEELRLKIRNRIKKAISILETDKTDSEEDEFITSLVERLKGLGFSNTAMLNRLSYAITSLDEAAIFTIHGFCQRMLNEFAFESSTPFSVDIIASEKELQYEAVREFLRQRLYKNKLALLPLWIYKEWGQKNSNIIEEIFKELAPLISLPKPLILPDISLDEVLEKFKGLLDILNSLITHKDKTIEIIKASYALDSFTNDPFGAFCHFLKACGMTEAVSEAVKEALEKKVKIQNPKDLLDVNFWDNAFEKAQKHLKGARKKEKKEALHIWDKVIQIKNDFLKIMNDKNIIKYKGITVELKAAFLRETREFLFNYVKKEKAQRGVISYDDMLFYMKEALHNKKNGKKFARLLEKRFPVALIDEFQDTDATQWEIFSAIYKDPLKSCLFLIGDPKQAIYGFRGADIFTYLRAKEIVPEKRRFSLDVNWRSSPQVLDAINVLFKEMTEKSTFILPGIEYNEVTPRPGEHEVLIIEHNGTYDSSAVEIWIEKKDENKNNQKPKRQRRLEPEELTAKEIRRLLALGKKKKAYFAPQNDISSDKRRPVEAKDITILVRDFIEANKVQNALAHVEISSVYYGPGSVFDTREAFETLCLLKAVLEPADVSAVSTALCTLAIGFDANELLAAKQDQARWDDIVSEFENLREIWLKKGVFAMLFTLFQHFNVPKNLLSVKGGERILTNMRHLAELLSQAEEKYPGPERLIQWLSENMANPDVRSEDQQLRLETDENLVKIMSYHRSKGLEFPILFLPFIKDLAPKGEQFKYYDSEIGDYVCRFENNLSKQKDEISLQAEAEIIRLGYVAFTRAKNKIYFYLTQKCLPKFISVTSDENEEENGTVKDKRFDLLASLKDVKIINANEKASEEEKEDNIKYFEEERPLSIIFPEIKRRPLAPWAWRRLSFSQLLSISDYESSSLLEHYEDSSHNIFSFPRGANAGEAIHSLFEEMDFRWSLGEIEDKAKEVLKRYGIDESWASIIAKAAYRCVNAHLPPGICLKKIDPKWLCKEMEFYMKFSASELEKYKKFFPEMESGILKGFIDLVFMHQNAFYILDYKSNWLGNRPSDYNINAIKQTMDEHSYWLQAAIYIKAINRFIKRRFSGNFIKHPKIKGAIYLFIRGISETNEGKENTGSIFVPINQLKSMYPSLLKEIDV